MTPIPGARKSKRVLPKLKEKEIQDLLKIYRQIDRKVAVFKKKSALECIPGCGECCRAAGVCASVLEMQPAARHLWEKGALDFWLDKIDLKDDKSPCVFYSAAVLDNGGHCHIYPFRPLICRLFGFSGRRNKKEKTELMVCNRMKAAYPALVTQVAAMVEEALQPPLFTNYIMKIYAVSLNLANESLNVNIAFAKAAEIIGYHGGLAALAKKGKSIA
jgi:uncharacterized protein